MADVLSMAEYLREDHGSPRLHYYLSLNKDGTITGVAETNDNLDHGYASEYASWRVNYDDRAHMLKRTGGCHMGCSGIEVMVFLDGEKVPRG